MGIGRYPESSQGINDAQQYPGTKAYEKEVKGKDIAIVPYKMKHGKNGRCYQN